MITFTTGSAALLAQLLDQRPALLDAPLNFDSGTQQSRVLTFTRITQEFDYNGMSHTAVIGYRLALAGGDELHINLGDGRVAHCAAR